MLESFDSRCPPSVVEKNRVWFLLEPFRSPALRNRRYDGITFLGKNAVKRIPNLGIVVDRRIVGLNLSRVQTVELVRSSSIAGNRKAQKKLEKRKILELKVLLRVVYFSI